MEHNERTAELLKAHCRAYPKLQPQDLFKYLYQSSFGCEHMVSSLEAVTERIRGERECLLEGGQPGIDMLDGAYSRVPLACLDGGLSVETLAKLFFFSAKEEPGGRPELERRLEVARELVKKGELPFSQTDFEEALEEWQGKGYPALHHSRAFREAYRPAYRVVANRYVKFLPLFERLDGMLEKRRTVVAVEGGSASGKTTLGEMLASLYDGTVFHMDDFFLRPEQRTAERYEEPGGNVDRERFLEEVLHPLKKGEPVTYRRFDCSTWKLGAPVEVMPKRLTVVEGAYSMHPELAPYYDLSVFLSISPQLQKARIAKRNTPETARRFYEEWIPLEQVYFSKTQAQARCDISVLICE